MSGECDECGEDCFTCKCHEVENKGLQKWEDDLFSETETLLKSLSQYFPEVKKKKK